MIQALPVLACRFLMHQRLRAIRFAGVGVVSTSFDLAIFLILEGFGLWLALANVIAFLCANVFSFFANTKFTFSDRGQHPEGRIASYRKFLFVHLFGLAASTTVLLAFAPSIGVLMAKGASIVVGFVVNYLLTSRFVFADPTRSHTK